MEADEQADRAPAAQDSDASAHDGELPRRSAHLVDQVYANVNVAALLKSALPPQLQPLAAPSAGAQRNAAVRGVELTLARPRVRSLWALVARRANHCLTSDYRVHCRSRR